MLICDGSIDVNIKLVDRHLSGSASDHELRNYLVE